MVNAGLTSFKKIEEANARELELVCSIFCVPSITEFYLNSKPQCIMSSFLLKTIWM
jgi:hypothetical protein